MAVAAGQTSTGLPIAISVVVITRNRGPILARCLDALLDQEGCEPYEVVVVDDGSSDGTSQLPQMTDPRVRYLYQRPGGRSAARDAGLAQARGRVLVYVDSDVFVVPRFLAAHWKSLANARGPAFSQGCSVDVAQMVEPRNPRVSIRDWSRAFFDTKNLAVPTELLRQAGGFSQAFTEYGWEDLEAGLRLRDLGAKRIKARDAVGFHFHPPATVASLGAMAEIERQRGRMGARFLKLRPTWEVRLMVGLTPFHRAACWILTAGGRRPDGAWPNLVKLLMRRPGLAAAVLPGLLFPLGYAELLRELADQEH